MFLRNTKANNYIFFFFLTNPKPAKPKPNKAMLAGSGTEKTGGNAVLETVIVRVVMSL
jgi:hypothetical protein